MECPGRRLEKKRTVHNNGWRKTSEEETVYEQRNKTSFAYV